MWGVDHTIEPLVINDTCGFIIQEIQSVLVLLFKRRPKLSAKCYKLFFGREMAQEIQIKKKNTSIEIYIITREPKALCISSGDGLSHIWERDEGDTFYVLIIKIIDGSLYD